MLKDLCESKVMPLTTIHAAKALGRRLETDYYGLLAALVKLLRREVHLLPRFRFEIVDARNFVSFHRQQLEDPNATRHCIIVANAFLWFRKIAGLLISVYHDSRITNREMPNWLSTLTSLSVQEVGTILNALDVANRLDNSTATDLGWRPRWPKQAALSISKSLTDLGVV